VLVTRRHRLYRLAEGAHVGFYAGAERGSRVVSQGWRDHSGDWVRATEHSPRDPFRLLERIYGLAEIVERGPGGHVERPRVITFHLERGPVTLPENASRHAYRL
jgi:hypothetical protein